MAIEDYDFREHGDLLGSDLPDFAFIVEGDVDAVTIYDSQWRFVYVNAAAERMTGMSRTDLLGKSIADLWPSAFEVSEFAPIRAAMTERTVVIARLPSASHPDMWREARAVPIGETGGVGEHGLLVYWRDITETRRLEEATRQADAYALAAASALDAVRDAFITLDPNFTITFANAEAGNINNKAVSEFVGRVFWDEWPTLIGSEVDEICRKVMSERTTRSFIRHRFVPGIHDQWLECTAYPDDVKGGIHLVYRDITNQKKLQEREQFLAALFERAQMLTDPDDVVVDAVKSLGRFLNVDRCVYAHVDLVADTSTIRTDYCAEGVASIAGVYPLSDFGEYLFKEFEAGRAVAVNDVRNDSLQVPADTIAAYEALGAIAHLTVPMVHNARLVSAIAVHSLVPRTWSIDDIELIQTVVERTWLTTEVVRQNLVLTQMRQRDHNIAQQLQRALIPDLPTQVPGLALRGYYRAALQEAEVGGDFSDCFAGRQRELTTIAVGDVSGKGLRAASQVAAIRNMLRFALHANDRIGQAVQQLNGVLVEQAHIDGFSTLFVGTFDAEQQTLTYVNCGQDPGLIWRAKTGSIDHLPPTGPVLGAFSDEVYEEATVSIWPGDVFALFTDGLTEAGPSRRHLLGIDGVAGLFQKAIEDVPGFSAGSPASEPGQYADYVVASLIREVEKYAGGASALRDDIVLMVGVVSEAD